ncbi:MAG: hypothetical protein GX307_06590 [Euryarchaeota archaeon]|nr:hypothetical protein [Euryarchaeota archaeon]
MHTVVCVGGGKIGSLAVTRARQMGDRVVVIDSDEGCLARKLCRKEVTNIGLALELEAGEAVFVKGDGVLVLWSIMQSWVPDLVVPGIRGHMLARLAMKQVNAWDRELTPSPDLLDGAVQALPPDIIQLIDREWGVLITSFMPRGGSCQEDCEQPKICPVSGKSHPIPMHRLIEQAMRKSVDHHAVLVTCGTGAGSLRGEDIQGLFHTLEEMKDGETCGIATSCSCHGLINMFRLKE